MIKFVLLFLVLAAFSTDGSNKNGDKKDECIFASLMNGLESDNFGLRTSAAYLLGEFRCDRAVILLMRMLKSEEREEARIVAALALLKIGDQRGIFAIKQAIRFDGNERVRRQCEKFFAAYSIESSTTSSLAVK